MAFATLLVASAGCGRSAPPAERDLEGAELVAGTSIPRHGVLVVPRAGGPAELRAVEDPSRVRWRGALPLPPSVEAHPIGRSVVLRGVGGEGFVFTPSGETLRELGPMPAEARWVPSPRGGAFVGAGFARIVREDAARDLEVEGAVLWAAPASSGRAVALFESAAGTALGVWEPGETEPAATRTVDSSGPAVLAAWGQEVVLPSADGRALIAHVLPDLAPAERARLDDAPAALAVSASEHRLFVTFASRPRVVAIDRYGWRETGSTRLAAPPGRVRPGVTGSGLLAFDGSTAWSIPPGRADAVAIPTEWRDDLPIVLPDGRILGLSGGVVRLFEADGTSGAPLEAPADAWWVPVRWRPRFTTPVVRAPDTAAAAAEGEEAAGPARMQGVGLTTMGRVSGRTVSIVDASGGARAGAPPSQAERAPAVLASVPNGFYAVATSSRQLETLEGLKAALERSGYPTQVLPRVDEANELWYRLMVGPFGSREEADAAAQRLERQRGISAWIHEVSGSTPGPGGP